MATQFPNWLSQSPQIGELQSTYRGLGKAFDTSGVENAYNAQMGQQTAQGLATTGAMQRAAQTRAQRTGGQVAASFAGGAAMLPYYQQNSEMQGQLADYKLRAASSRAQLQAGLGETMAGLRQRQTGMQADFYSQQQGREQAGSQFSQSLEEQRKQFAAQQALRLRQQGNEESRYRDALALQQSQAGGRDGGLPSWGQVASMMSTQNRVLGSPQASHYWEEMGATANQGGFEDQPVFGTGDPSSLGGGGYRPRRASSAAAYSPFG